MISLDQALQLEGYWIEIETRLGEVFEGKLSDILMDRTLKIKRTGTERGPCYIPLSQATAIRSLEAERDDGNG